ncbi:hypothetical protein [Paracoccus yeei]|uniref:hypothetical protein n=1 Tax=Paracoccus yeei TaxID=147645 RepID=UPI003BF8F762
MTAFPNEKDRHRAGDVAGGIIDRSDKDWMDPSEETGSDIQHNITVYGSVSTCAVHGFVQRAAGVYAVRIHNDAVAGKAVIPGVMLKLKDGTEMTVKRVRPTADAAWLVASCDVVE